MRTYKLVSGKTVITTPYWKTVQLFVNEFGPENCRLFESQRGIVWKPWTVEQVQKYVCS